MDYMKVKGSILVVSGPSGSGKTSLARAVCEELGERAYFSVSTTTRPKREGEKNGVDYFFVSREEFLKHTWDWKEKYGGNFPSQMTVITGPSRTADIEKTLVMGAHGPKELYVFMIDDL